MTKRTIFQFLWLVLALYACYTLSKSLWQLYQAGKRVTTQEQKLETLKGEVAGLQTRLEYVRSYEFLEKEARDKLNLQRPGEIVLVVPQAEEKEADMTQQPGRELKTWEKWLRLFL